MAGKTYREKAVDVYLNSLLSRSSLFSESATDYSELITSITNIKEFELKPDYGNTVLFHCAACHRVLSDSLEVCGEYRDLNSVLCARVTEDVVIREEMEFETEGTLSECVYHTLQCAGCCSFLGIILISTPKNLAAGRNIFLLQKEAITCYDFKVGNMVKASAVTFETVSIEKTIGQLKQEMEEIEEYMAVIESKLKDASSCKNG